MGAYAGTCPLTQRQLIEEYFIEHRTKILDIAAFLDRLERSVERDAEDDFRIVSFRRALETLCSPDPGRTERVQLIFSDPTTEPLARLDRKGAFGAFAPRRSEG